jgi:hypothetical protein
VDELPEHLKRYPTRAGRDGLATRLGLTIDPFSQDWEWEVADPTHFDEWLAVYRAEPLSDDERFSLMEMLIQCIDDMVPTHVAAEEVEALPQWQAVAALLRERPRLHASTIAYWSLFGHADPEQQLRVSVPMRRVWAAVGLSLG